MAYGNRRSVTKYGGEVLTKAAANVALGRSLVFTVTRLKGIMGTDSTNWGGGGGETARHPELNFSGDGVDIRKTRGTKGDKVEGSNSGDRSRSVDAETDWETIPKCQLARVMTEVIL